MNPLPLRSVLVDYVKLCGSGGSAVLNPWCATLGFSLNVVTELALPLLFNLLLLLSAITATALRKEKSAPVRPRKTTVLPSHCYSLVELV